MDKRRATKNIQNTAALETVGLRALFERISAAALTIDAVTSPDQAAKLSGLMINLAKAIRETENYNQTIRAAEADTQSGNIGGTLEERLQGYAPSASELKKLRAELRERMQVLGPRLLEDES